MPVLIEEVTGCVFSRCLQAFFIQVWSTFDIHFLRQSGRLRCVHYYNEPYDTHVELVKGLLYGLSFFFPLVEMLRQVKSLLPHCGLLKFYELLISRTNQISKEMPTLPEESFAMEKGSPM